MTDVAPPTRDRTFGPALLAGLGGAALAAVAATRTWATATGDAAGVAVEESVSGSSAAPLAASLALVALASWGALLVLRGQVRRAVAVLALLAAAGAAAAAALGTDAARQAAVDAAAGRGAVPESVATQLTAWPWVTVAAALLAAAAAVAAVLRAPRWPAMGTRYDAPATRASGAQDDLWRAMDEGRDPTQ